VNTQGDEYLDLSTPSAREHKINEKIYKTSCLPLSFYGNNLRLSTIENNLHKSIALGDITAVEKVSTVFIYMNIYLHVQYSISDYCLLLNIFVRLLTISQ
jgi:hypothetical protein